MITDIRLSFDELEYFPVSHRGAPDYAVVADPNAFGKTGRAAGAGVRNKVSYRAIKMADVNAPMPARVVAVFPYSCS